MQDARPDINQTNANTENIISISSPLQIKKRGIETKLVIPGVISEDERNLDENLVKAVACAHVYFEEVISGKVSSLEKLAKREGVSRSYISRLIKLAFLSLQIVEDILDGQHPVDLTVEKLSYLKLPLSWEEQASALDF